MAQYQLASPETKNISAVEAQEKADDCVWPKLIKRFK